MPKTSRPAWGKDDAEIVARSRYIIEHSREHLATTADLVPKYLGLRLVAQNAERAPASFDSPQVRPGTEHDSRETPREDPLSQP